MTLLTALKNSEKATYKSINQISLNFAFENEDLLKSLYEDQQLRLYKVKNVDKTYKLTIDEIVDLYKKWISQDEYVKLPDGRDIYLDKKERRVLYVKASKRGNDIYVWRSKKRTELLDLAFTKYDPERIGRKYIRSRIIWIVLTFKRDDLRKDWQNIRPYINEFMKKLRNIKIGIDEKAKNKPFKNAKIICRTNEAHKDGYIHINLIIDIGQEILGKRYKTKKNKTKYIIVNELIRSLIKKCWNYGYSDIGVLAKLNDKNYFTKYITKTIKMNEDPYIIDKQILTLSLNWFFRKRSFYINYSYELLKSLRLDNNMRSDPKDEGENEVFYIREKIVLAKDMNFDPKIWFYEIIEPFNIEQVKGII
jgi:co-chaperonin GroES (HSP10)